MSKIREWSLLKFFAELFLGLGLLFGLVSGLLVVEAYENGYFMEDGEERVRENIIDWIASSYDDTAIQYYTDVALKESDNIYSYDSDFYEDYFSEENTNYMFKITSNEEENHGEVLLQNYTIPEAKYETVYATDVYIDAGNDKLTYEIDFSKLVLPVPASAMEKASNGYYVDDGYTYFYAVPDCINVEYEQPCNAYVVNTKKQALPDEAADKEVSVSKKQTEVTDNKMYVSEAATEAPYNVYTEYDSEVYATTEAVIYEEYSESNINAPYIEIDAASLGYEDYVTDKMTIYTFYEKIEFDNLYLYEVGNGTGGTKTGICIDDYLTYVFEDNLDFVSVKDEFLQGQNNYDYYNKINMEYDLPTNTYTETYEGGYIQNVTLHRAVKENFTASDSFKNSNRLRYLPKLFSMAMPVFIISAIVCLITFVYLLFAVGHRKGVEGIYIGGFDKIPYDVVLVGYLGLMVLGCLIFDEFFYYSDGFVRYILKSIPMAIVIVLLPLVFFSAVTRIKAGVLFKDLIIVKVLKWCWRLLKKLGGRIGSGLNYLRKNLNLYWKWIGGFVAILFLELLIIMGFGSEELAYFLILADIAVAVAVIAFGVVNMHKLRDGARKIASGDIDYKIDTDHMLWEFKNHGETLNSISDGLQLAVNERMKSEHMQTELITNVTHDIKTPLTSIISYVDLLSKEELNNEKADEYVEVLSRQSERLKKLIEDLIEASKATTGNLKVELSDVDVKVLLEQSLGEFSDKLEAKGLKPVVNFHTKDTVVRADGKHLWRVFDNLINNISKYAQENTRVYIDVESTVSEEVSATKTSDSLRVSFKNISKEELNISGDELMARFVRGDKSRNTEGNGLGLSIAKSLMKIQGGDIDIVVDGDLFKVIVTI